MKYIENHSSLTVGVYVFYLGDVVRIGLLRHMCDFNFPKLTMKEYSVMHLTH